MSYARGQGLIAFAHDPDFGVLLAAPSAEGPSVIHVRPQNVLPKAIGSLVQGAIGQFETELLQGALVPIRSRG